MERLLKEQTVNARLQFGMHCENKHLIKNNTISHYVQLCEKNF